MPTSLDFVSTEKFRNDLMVRNLKPYTVPGVYTPPVNQVTYETVLSNYSVIDSPDEFISENPFADKLYPLNSFGPEGGYPKTINVGGLATLRTNLGPYDYTDARLTELSLPTQREIPSQNRFSSTNPIQAISIGNIQSVPTFRQYTDPLGFIPSSYSPYQILLQDNPTGSNGSLSQDSFIAQLGSRILKREFNERIGRELIENTVGRVNLLSAIGDPVDTIQLLRGARPLIERDWVITRPSNILLRAADFATRLSGFYFPGSVIPGDYFTQPQNNLSLFGQIAKAFNGGKDPRVTTDDEGNQRSTGVGKLFGRFLTKNSPSQLFLNNTGGGQKSQLYFNLGLNRYSPDYEKSIVGEIVDVAKKAFNSILDKPTKGGYYVGNKQLDASRINSPNGTLPIDPFGREIVAPVYGPDKLSKQFEGADKDFRFGLNGKSFTDNGGDLTGGFVWTSPKYNSDQIKGVLRSSTFEFVENSILDITQRFVVAADDLNGPQRYSHVGNAINQISTIFHDGYKQITKASAIKTFTNPSKGVHQTDNVYCRIFTKERPYRTFSDLQKTDGITTEGRRFSYSVLDKTYNLNIAPIKGVESTNIVNGKVKKYMFSIENLAWRTSNREGYRVQDLPECERGPNGGRIMWFPPYDLTFSEGSKPQFQSNNFLGRPEPIYTYQNTTRDGQLSWKIIVDHPSILNVIVNKELKNEKNYERINEIVDSFFAGCLKYDIYELAKRWNTIPTDQLFILQQTITNSNVKEEDIQQIKKEVPKSEDIVFKSNPVSLPDLTKYVNLGYYFENDEPNPKTRQTTTSENYSSLYSSYISSKETYSTYSNENGSFFDNVIEYNFKTLNEELVKDITTYFEQFPKSSDGTSKAQITITLNGQASAPNSVSYNENLSKRRIASVVNYFNSVSTLQPFISKKQLIIKDGSAEGESGTSNPKSKDGTGGGSFSCTDQDTKKYTSSTGQVYDPKFSIPAMACRRVYITNVVSEPAPPATEGVAKPPQNDPITDTPAGFKPSGPTIVNISTEQKIKDGISKKILRYLLSECDYFELVKETNPMYYDSIKEKIKYFNPAFHSITPEGLNSRLTFLQQCTRPGDTIPVIGSDGKAKYTSAVNTNFGTPPVLVLRIGDFFNTKIIPTNLSIQYESTLDINPEGIGVQPMIAKVSLSFNIVGGMGLKEPVEKLQNALSFNFYANTEIYDERADATDDSYKIIDQEVVKDILAQSEIESVNNVKNNIENNGGNTIGVIENKVETDSGTTGTITYQKIMTDLFTEGQTYIEKLSNKIPQIIKDNNFQLYKLYISESSYNKGKNNQFESSSKELKIFGKPKNIESKIKKVTDQVIRDINRVDNESDEGLALIQRLYKYSFNKSKVIKVVKRRLIDEIERQSAEVSNRLSVSTQDIVDTQQKLVQVFSKLDLIATKTDGFIKQDQQVQIYNISATTEVGNSDPRPNNTYDELINDYNFVTDKLSSFYDDLKKNNLVETKFDIEDSQTLGGQIGNNIEDIRFYTIMSSIFLDNTKYSNFIDNLTKGIENELSSETRKLKDFIKEYYFDTFKIKCEKEKESEKKVIGDIITNGKDGSPSLESKYKNSFDDNLKSKIRKFTFTSKPDGTSQQKTRLKNIYKNGNSNNDSKSYNGKTKFN